MKTRHFASISALAALATVLVDAGGGRAAIFTVDGQDYDVTTFSGSYNDNSSLFATPANGGVMPWWGNQTLATQFATTIAASLGFPNPQFNFDQGPRFGFDVNPSYASMSAWTIQSSVYTSVFQSRSVSTVWAQATVVPGPLPILGAATAFGMSRRLRRRIKSQSYKL
ncbi:MAG: hypothetical protein FJ083_17700 [Cyanobacteria bacterium K_Offshore_surface_m2_239]|nr:hypothetical protein [Cyanobacteria bacterium K_Offshore_surface_m2_239]